MREEFHPLALSFIIYRNRLVAQLVLATYVLACFSACKQSSPATTFQSNVSFIIALIYIRHFFSYATKYPTSLGRIQNPEQINNTIPISLICNIQNTSNAIKKANIRMAYILF